MIPQSKKLNVLNLAVKLDYLSPVIAELQVNELTQSDETILQESNGGYSS